MTAPRSRRHAPSAAAPTGGLTRRGFLSIALAAGAVGTWGARPAVAAPTVAAATPAAANTPPERPHRTLLGVL
ncbi:MAG: hypothetical protein BGO45_07095 [Microbacterium sp. 71-36]|uniref:hypothetical protein n=1 Tax=unclassified Microbacterium TaxID=2609290 RepID=UPI00086B236E|nr:MULTISPECIES: hypothetical protein [unclassified Microbacterium]MBN9211580.1 hypothetical protein [Microbacterium sp.]ODT38125.1 MAG: hypothetical protein ABS60_11230 [Microbacterium sp. SCN 71-17]OJV75436.1 MAG: hypothetical protein BGO45_07095 [Microbacterium sp. 71-36]